MKRTKRPLALLLVLLMIFALCACGGKSESAPAATAAPEKTEAPAPAEEKPGVGKYGMKYLELSQAYMEGLFAKYGLTAKPGVGSRKLTPEDMEDWYVELKNDGTGYLYWGDDNQGPIDEWKLDGEKLTFKAGVADIEGSIKDGLMLVTVDDGYDMYFATVGTKLPKVELITMDDYIDLLFDDGAEEAEAEEPEKEAESAAQEAVPVSDGKKKDSKSEKEVKPAVGKEETQEAPSDVTGFYYLYAAGIEDYWVRMDDFPEEKNGTIEIKADGTFVVSYPDTDDFIMTWEEKDGEFHLYNEEGTFSYAGLIEAVFLSDGVFDYLQAASAFPRIYARADADVSFLETISIAEYNALAS